MSLTRFIERGSIIKRGRRCRRYLGRPRGVVVRSRRILGVRITRCLGKFLRWRRFILPIRGGYGSARCITEELRSLTVGTVDRHVGDMEIIARPVTLTGVVIRPVKGAGPGFLAAAFLVGMIGGDIKPTKFVFILGT